MDQHGAPFSVDLGGALEYRARGKPKGSAFGDQVTELDAMRDPHIAPDAAGVFGDITPTQFRESARRVTQITDDEIRDAVDDSGSPPELADKLIKRRDDIANRAKHFGAKGDPKKATSSVVFVAGEQAPVDKLNGVKFAEWGPPKDWNDVDGQADLDEEPLPETLPTHKQLSSGLIIREKDGRVWLMRPKDAYGGYDATFPKGRVEPNLSMQANAIKEAWEETGLKAKITGLLGDREGDVTTTRYYIGEREGGDPSKPMGGETEGVVLAPASDLDGFLNRDRDRKIAAELSTGAADQAFDAIWEESKHKRGQPGNAGQFGSGGGGAQQQQKPQQTQQPQRSAGGAQPAEQVGQRPARKMRSEAERAFGRRDRGADREADPGAEGETRRPCQEDQGILRRRRQPQGDRQVGAGIRSQARRRDSATPPANRDADAGRAPRRRAGRRDDRARLDPGRDDRRHRCRRVLGSPLDGATSASRSSAASSCCAGP